MPAMYTDRRAYNAIAAKTFPTALPHVYLIQCLRYLLAFRDLQAKRPSLPR
jgi:hypothetical protein